MTQLMDRLLPSATNMIRLDHTHVMSTFHQYKPHSSARVKKGLVNTICTALEVHAQLEEEIFYPAVRQVTDDALIQEAMAEHAEMRRLIEQLRGMEPDHAEYDATVMSLMRDVIHHVADEETLVLPEAERKMGDRLGELGTRMTKRRMQLVVPRTGEIATDMGRAITGNTAALAVAALAGAGLLMAHRASGRRDSARSPD